MFPSIVKRFNRNLAGWLFVAPAMALTFLFFVYPLLNTIWISFHEYNVIRGTMEWVGGANYARMGGDEILWKAIRNTTLYTLVVTPLIFLVAFPLALLVNQRVRGVTFFRAAYFLPGVISYVTASFIWKWMYQDLFGLINYVLVTLGIVDQPILWMSTASRAMLSVIIMIVWKTAGFSMLILLGGLQAIPTEVYEAAQIDGAGRWSTFWRVTFPLLRPTFALALVLSVIGSFLAFDHFYVMTQGGPAHGTETIVMWIYRNSFAFFNLGYGAAISIVLLLFLVVLSVLQLRVLRSPVEY